VTRGFNTTKGREMTEDFLQRLLDLARVGERLVFQAPTGKEMLLYSGEVRMNTPEAVARYARKEDRLRQSLSVVRKGQIKVYTPKEVRTGKIEWSIVRQVVVRGTTLSRKAKKEDTGNGNC